jgi:glycosyltransferase involved in cell wall biosynthesis
MLLQVFGGPSFLVEDAASWLAQRFRIPIIMVLRGGAMPDFMRRHPRWNRRVLNRAASLVAPSDYLKQAIRPFGFDAEVIPNIINVDQYPYRHRTNLQPRLLWMRAFHPVYNPQLAIRAFVGVAAAYRDASMVMAGEEKGLEPECRALVRQLGLADSVRFAGFLDMESKVREGNSADIYLNTNRIDNMPVSVVEAGAMGIPVVATAVGGVPFLLEHERSGLLVPDDDAGSTTDAILRLLGDSELAGRLSLGGRRLAERSAWEEVKPRWTALFDRVAGRELREGGM